jgi:hypothetical protein
MHRSKTDIVVFSAAAGMENYFDTKMVKKE